MTYMGGPYYPRWLDNLADDATGDGAAFQSRAQGADAVRAIVLAARDLYEPQDFSFIGDYGDRFLEPRQAEHPPSAGGHLDPRGIPVRGTHMWAFTRDRAAHRSGVRNTGRDTHGCHKSGSVSGRLSESTITGSTPASATAMGALPRRGPPARATGRRSRHLRNRRTS
jgi:hypothetical protein